MIRKGLSLIFKPPEAENNLQKQDFKNPDVTSTCRELRMDTAIMVKYGCYHGRGKSFLGPQSLKRNPKEKGCGRGKWHL